jgi:hypothetical protein
MTKYNFIMKRDRRILQALKRRKKQKKQYWEFKYSIKSAAPYPNSN